LFQEIEQCEIFMTEIDALRQKRMRCGKKGSASVAGARLFALQQRALDRQSAVSNEGVGLRTSLPGWRGHARLEESSITTAGARPQPSFSPSSSLCSGGAQ
jgi:hypothetical protein